MNTHPEVQNFYSMMLPIMLLALMGWGEARGEPEEGKYAVAWVARNRVYARRNYGKTWEKVLLRKNAFSCFNDTVKVFIRRPGIFNSSNICDAGHICSVIFYHRHAKVSLRDDKHL